MREREEGGRGKGEGGKADGVDGGGGTENCRGWGGGGGQEEEEWKLGDACGMEAPLKGGYGKK